MRREHPLIVALVEAFARKADIDLPLLWRALDGEPVPAALVNPLVDAFHPTVRPSDFVIEGLPSVSNAATIDTPMQTQSTHAIRGARPTRNKATETLRAAGVSIAEVADALGVPYSTARSWFQEGAAGRAVPAKHAAALLKRYGVKASDLPNGVVGK